MDILRNYTIDNPKILDHLISDAYSSSSDSGFKQSFILILTPLDINNTSHRNIAPCAVMALQKLPLHQLHLR